MARDRKQQQTERLMDRAIALNGQPHLMQKLDTETLAAVAACYDAPYHTYGRVVAYIKDYGKLPPEQYRKPRYTWQTSPTPGALCQRCQKLRSDGTDQMTCQMLQLRGAVGMHGSVVHCSEYRRKVARKQNKARENEAW